ncbi:uncharacterized protein CTHT_0065310 [Thermochaetoides thermophila DSM 1495]|uniref:Uncharacterized protein n=1 Tax=Chaetomium thermophilum (strain DSM 1495 / CBS 144.50 / IMI 039719) TaxID=759272 RepID=G0SG75_CHATD|nr:hypothetical protein CTHT_0065310 [Thermochaetoides thermophila DSM 1495]EGS17214.1 hypothetical protein CTHT_0065310 [Thermochaetoides thermophila DSM 1495]
MLRLLLHHLGKARFRLLLLAFPLVLTLIYFSSRAEFYELYYERPRLRIPGRQPAHSPDWWVEFFTRLQATRVKARPVKFKGEAPLLNWAPDLKDEERPQLLRLSEKDEALFRESHENFVRQLPLFAKHLPYKENTTGIVTTAGAPNFGQAISLVLMTRQSGSQLPIEIVLDSSTAWIDWVCENTMPRFGATCLYLEDEWVGIGQLVPKLERYQWKFIAIIASTFQNIMFLDADCLPVRSPDPIFDDGAEPFTSTGFIAWPDFWAPSASPLFYKIAGGLDVPTVASRTTSESGVMVFDKARHADTILLAAYYNYNGPNHYYPMLTQHGPGEGDKESFFQAALVLEGLRKLGVYKQPTEWMKPGVGVKKGYWDVKMLPRSHGRSIGDQWRGMFMQQMDPIEDYRAVMAALEKRKQEDAQKAGDTEEKSNSEAKAASHNNNSAEEADTDAQSSEKRKRSWEIWAFTSSDPDSNSDDTATLNTPAYPPGPQHNPHSNDNNSNISNTDKNGTFADEESYLTDSTFLSSLPPDFSTLLHHDESKFMFFHHNGVKPDFTLVLDSRAGILAKNKEKKYVRMWGDPGWIVQRLGRDVEKLLWEASMEIYCQGGLTGRWRLLERVCRKMRKVWEEVYADKTEIQEEDT